jgi:hypothetical protein
MSSQQPILHIGLHKTGTTWFQKRFYPIVKNAKYIEREIVKEKILLPGMVDFKAEDTRDFFIRLEDRIIICEENLTTGIRGNYFVQEGLLNRMKMIFPDAKIVLFLRNQVEKIASTYCYYLKNNGGTFGFQKFIGYRHNNPYNNFNFKPENLFYDRLLEILFRYFSRDNVHIFFYEDFSSDNQEFLKQFSEKLDLNIDLENISFARENERIRAGLIPFARFSNLFTKPQIHHRGIFLPVPGWAGMNRRLLRALNKWRVFGKPPTAFQIMGKENYEYFSSYYKSSNQNLIERYGLTDIERFNYPL